MTLATNIGNAIADTRRTLAAAGIDTAALDARILVADATGLDRSHLIGWSDRLLSTTARERLADRLRRRLAREPIAYIVGEKEFWSLGFAVDRRVLVPRPDSEALVEAALSQIKDRSWPLRILDLGTGSGCLLLALLSELPAAWGVGVDLSAAALDVARLNADRLGFTQRTAFLQGHWATAIGVPFDLVVANPPYVAEADWRQLEPEIVRHEPPLALLAGDDGLAAYRRILPDLARILAVGGVACLEMGAGQHDAVIDIAASAGLECIRASSDLAGVVRCVQLQSAKAAPAEKWLGNKAFPV